MRGPPLPALKATLLSVSVLQPSLPGAVLLTGLWALALIWSAVACAVSVIRSASLLACALSLP